MKIQQILVLATLSLYLLAPTVHAQGFFSEFDPVKFIFGPDVPQEWYQTNTFMQFLVFPFLGIWFVIWGILEELRIFRVRPTIGAFLALIMALIASSTGGVVLLTRALFQIMGGWSILVFFAVFMVGATLWGYGTMRHHYVSAVSLYKTYKDEETKVMNQIADLETQYQNAMRGNPPDVAKMEQLADDVRKLQARLDEVRKAYSARPP